MPTSEVPPNPDDEAAQAAQHIARLHERGRTAPPQDFHDVLDALATCDSTIAGWCTRDTNRHTKRAVTTALFLLGLLLILNGPVELLLNFWSVLGIGLLAAPGMFALELQWLSKHRSDDRPALRIAVGAVLEHRESPERNRQRDHRDRLRGLLPVHPGAVFSTGPLAAGSEIHPDEAAHGLGMLRDEGLIAQLPDGRWQRLGGPRDGAELLPDPADDPGRYLAQHAMVEWYVRHMAEVDKILNPTSHRSSWVFADVAPETITFVDTATALGWFEAELTNILAAFRLAVTRGWDLLIIGLAEALWNPLRVTGRAPELAGTQLLGADAAARRVDALEPIFRARQGLGLSDCGDREAALAVCTTAVSRATALDDLRAQATALSARAHVNIGAGDVDAAQRDLHLALDLDERRGDRRGIALGNQDLGELALREKINSPWLAEHHLSIASVLFRLLGDEIGYARCRIPLARARLRLGHVATALTVLHDVEGILRAHGVPRYLAALATVLAEIYRALGDTARADAYLAEVAAFSAARPGSVSEADQDTAVGDHDVDPPHPDLTDPQTG